MATLLAYPLESRYPQPIIATSKANTVVVLGGGAYNNKTANSSTLQRLVYGISILNNIKQQPNTKQPVLILSGGPPDKAQPNEAKIMRKIAIQLGVDKKYIKLDPESKDTAEQARILKKQLTDKPFFLVTSSVHMPRSMMMFQQQHTQPIAAPCEQDPPGSNSLLPTPSSLGRSTAAIHEYIGIIWHKLVTISH